MSACTTTLLSLRVAADWLARCLGYGGISVECVDLLELTG